MKVKYLRRENVIRYLPEKEGDKPRDEVFKSVSLAKKKILELTTVVRPGRKTQYFHGLARVVAKF